MAEKFMTKDPLPSWTQGPVKRALTDFVTRACFGPAPVPVRQRIAVFDHDGTLWCERPVQAQVMFALDRLDQLVKKNPELAEREPYRSFMKRDMKKIASFGKQGVFEFAMTTHAGMSVPEFERIAENWLAGACHPKYRRPLTDCVYRPQRELIDYLHTAQFRVYIVSAGGTDFMRAFAEDAYGIAPERVIGSSLKTRVDMQGGRITLMRRAVLESFNDREAKVQNIHMHIGQRPILAFGNSDGDLSMLRYTMAGSGARMALLLHHDDDRREYAYDRDFKLSPLSEGLDHAREYGLTLVSMQRDWSKVFVDARAPMAKAG